MNNLILTPDKLSLAFTFIIGASSLGYIFKNDRDYKTRKREEKQDEIISILKELRAAKYGK